MIRTVLLKPCFVCWLYPLLMAFSLSLFASSDSPHILVVGLFKDAAVLKINGQQQLLKVGQTSAEGVFLESANSKEATLKYEDKFQVFPLGVDIGRGFAVRETGKVIIGITPRGQYLTEGSINSLPVTFLVDTGATSIAMSKSVAKRLGIDFRVTGTKGSTNTAGGVVRSWVVKLKSVKVGDISVRNVHASVLEGTSMDKVLLGMTFLSRVSMREERGIMYLEQKF